MVGRHRPGGHPIAFDDGQNSRTRFYGYENTAHF